MTDSCESKVILFQTLEPSFGIAFGVPSHLSV